MTETIIPRDTRFVTIKEYSYPLLLS